LVRALCLSDPPLGLHEVAGKYPCGGGTTGGKISCYALVSAVRGDIRTLPPRSPCKVALCRGPVHPGLAGGVCHLRFACSDIRIPLAEKITFPLCSGLRFINQPILLGDGGLPLGGACFLDVHLLLGGKQERRRNALLGGKQERRRSRRRQRCGRPHERYLQGPLLEVLYPRTLHKVLYPRTLHKVL
jgi:hypothetical protein